jgi:hypothetical protein
VVLLALVVVEAVVVVEVVVEVQWRWQQEFTRALRLPLTRSTIDCAEKSRGPSNAPPAVGCGLACTLWEAST